MSTEPAASKFDERGSDVADARYRTPLPIGRSTDAAGTPKQPPRALVRLVGAIVMIAPEGAFNGFA